MRLLLLAATILLLVCFGESTLSTVDTLDPSRYAGVWHEIARLPMYFQRDCSHDVTATYFVDGANKLGIRNACVRKDGEILTAYGTAYVPDAKEPGKLKATFVGGWLQWVPFLWADYWVLQLDDDYRWAMVGEPSLKYLWILSRNRSMSTTVFEGLKRKASEAGYDLSGLIVSGGVPDKCGKDSEEPTCNVD